MKARLRTPYDEIHSGFKGREDLLFAAMDFLKQNQYEQAMEVVREDDDTYRETMTFDLYACRMGGDRCEQIYQMMERVAKIYLHSIAGAKHAHQILQNLMAKKSMYILRPVFNDAADLLHGLVMAYYNDHVEETEAWLSTHVELAEAIRTEIHNVGNMLNCTPVEAWNIVFEGLRLLDNKLKGNR